MKIKVFNDKKTGQSWVVRLIQRGDGYGKQDAVMHEDDEPLVEFFDTRYEHTDLGQFVSRYFRRTLLESEAGGLCLQGGVPSWTVHSDCMARVRLWLKNV
jgi:hypothetical protein